MWTNSCVQPQLLEFEVMQTVWILKGRRRPLSLWLAKQHLELYQNIAQLFLESIESTGNHLVNTSRSRGPYLFLCLCHRSLTAGRTMWLFGRMRFPAVPEMKEPSVSRPGVTTFLARSLLLPQGPWKKNNVLKKHHMSQKQWSKSNNFSHKTYYIYEIQIPDHNYKKEYKWCFPATQNFPWIFNHRHRWGFRRQLWVVEASFWVTAEQLQVAVQGSVPWCLHRATTKMTLRKPGESERKMWNHLDHLVWGGSFCYRTFLKDDESTVYVCVCVSIFVLIFCFGRIFLFCLVAILPLKKVVGERLSSQTTSGVTRTWGAFIQSSLLNSCHRSPGYLVAEVVFYL